MITKNSVVKIQNLVLNHELRPIKSNGFYQIHHVYRFKDFGEIVQISFSVQNMLCITVLRMCIIVHSNY